MSELSTEIGNMIRNNANTLRSRGAKLDVNHWLPRISVTHANRVVQFREGIAEVILKDALRLAGEYQVSLNDVLLYQMADFCQTPSMAGFCQVSLDELLLHQKGGWRRTSRQQTES